MQPELKNVLIEAQRNEISEYHVYKRLANRAKAQQNKDVLLEIAKDEKRHYEFWAEQTGVRLGPRRFWVFKYTALARLFGLTFAVKLMEKGECGAQVNYGRIVGEIPQAQAIVEDEGEHEKELTNMIDEERLRYAGSIVLGLSDALVELTGALAGLTLALRDSRLIAVIGLITGIAAAMSMAASEYLSTRHEEENSKSAPKAALYTGVAYIFAVAVLICPYLLAGSAVVALLCTLSLAMVLIWLFTYYVSVARDFPLLKRFGEMAGLTLSVAAASFLIGFIVRTAFGVDI